MLRPKEDEAFPFDMAQGGGSAVPPHFPAKGGTLCDRLTQVFAVTGDPVPFYFHLDFFGTYIRRLRRCFPVDASTVRILLYQDTPRLLLLSVWIIRSRKSSVKEISSKAIIKVRSVEAAFDLQGTNAILALRRI